MHSHAFDNPRRAAAAALRQLDGAYSPDSLRCYRSDLATFFEWCDRQAISLPIDPDALARFIDEQGDRVAAGSAVRRLVAIGHYHRLAGFDDPSKAVHVRLAVRRIRRKTPRRPRQALGLTADLRDLLIAQCPDTLHGLRDRAMVAIGYDTLCRRSELVALRVEDIATRQGGGGTALIRRSKTDPFGKGRVASISRHGWVHLETWFKAAGLEEGAAFRRIYHGHVQPGAVGPEQVSRLLKRLAGEAGLSPQTQQALSGHSLRVGAAQDLAARGRDIIQIMRAGGWKSTNVVGRYVEHASIDVWD